METIQHSSTSDVELKDVIAMYVACRDEWLKSVVFDWLDNIASSQASNIVVMFELDNV